MEKKIAIVNKMVANGYFLDDETVEHFAERFDLAVLEIFADNFLRFIKN